MTNSSALPRKLIIFAFILPLAALVGFQLANPDFGSFLVFSLLAAVLCVPLLLRWHHPLLIFSWNAWMQVFFLPGQPEMWMLLSGVSLMITVASRLLLKHESQTYVPSVVWPLIFLSLVVVVTAELTGGIGLRVLGGSSYGGKRYVYLAAAVIGYFALASRRIPISKAGLYTGLFFLSSITNIMGNLIYLLGPSAWFLYAVFPVGGALYHAQADFAGSDLVRLVGFTFMGAGICKFMLCRFGIQGLLVVHKPWRFVGFLAAIFITLLGGFRSGLLTILILCAVLFFLEGLYRTRLVITVLIAAVLAGAVLVPFARKMPLSVQRALAFLPINVSPVARMDALASSEWRVRMWKVLWPDVPRYLLLGKGSSISPKDLYLAGEAIRRGHAESHESALVAGDYHSAPLTLVIQFGLGGVIAFLWFCVGSLRHLYRAYRTGPPELKRCNTFLLSLFITNLICFAVILGSFSDELYLFTGIIGLSVSLNGSLRTQSNDKAVKPQG
jgi:hypothetical protein